jgi:hypothetical protein
LVVLAGTGNEENMNRRTFIQATAGAIAAAPFVGAATRKRKRVAILITEVRKHSHGQHFLDRFLEGYGWRGAWHHPEVELVSIYVDQFPENDLSRDRSKRFNVPIYPSIAEALTLGKSKLAVDGVIIIAEHGKYPKNEIGQTLYPRYRFFKQTTDVFKESGRAVPVFNDKHLSTDWKQCVEMVETSKRLGFPFLAGSSLPVTWRMPSLEIPNGTALSASVSICYGGVDSYDFHGLETAQCMSERRKGWETGIKSVQALRGPAVWTRLEADEQIRKLFLAALSRSETRRAPQGYTFARPTMELAKEFARDPIGYFYEHNDGFHTAMFMMNGLVSDFTYAGQRRDTGEIATCIMYLPMPGATATTADFFNPLCNHIEQMILSGRAPYPIERTLLTSGMTAFAVESLHRGQVEISTPELSAVKYRAPRESNFWKA